MTPHTRSEVGLPRWQRQLPSDPPLASEWLWCLICERAYPRDERGRALGLSLFPLETGVFPEVSGNQVLRGATRDGLA